MDSSSSLSRTLFYYYYLFWGGGGGGGFVVIVICFILIYLLIYFSNQFIFLTSPVSATKETSLIFLECVCYIYVMVCSFFWDFTLFYHFVVPYVYSIGTVTKIYRILPYSGIRFCWVQLQERLMIRCPEQQS